MLRKHLRAAGFVFDKAIEHLINSDHFGSCGGLVPQIVHSTVPPMKSKT